MIVSVAMDWLQQDVSSKLEDFINVVLPEILLSNASDDKRSALFKNETVIQNDGMNVQVHILIFIPSPYYRTSQSEGDNVLGSVCPPLTAKTVDLRP